MNWAALDLSILGPALVAGLLVVATHVPLGRSVLSRGIIFIDLAIAQIAGLGVIAANVFGWETDGWMIQVAAVSAAMLGALFLHWTEKRFPEIQEALIGVVFALGATMGLLLLANNPHGGEELKDLLVGQILWVSFSQLIPVAVLYALVLVIWFRFDVPKAHRLLFYLLFAVTVTASVQLVGVYLVFASLIIPALGARNYKARPGLAVAYLLGAAGYVLGLVASALFDLPSGAVIVWTLAVMGIVGGYLVRYFPSAKAERPMVASHH
ncbi:metal ABC transporter permease [Gallaecimonas kandeliae]|uniref:metal ABC transporter permease n=1 Tax=Gallaecimonas kandeliae TaxID=3029055 RepID=UPI0026471DB8|nr:metal ABC transporter permease [Gallaecimonas kandeliae]WKE65856.1 metal ABC transporter permease [Gallaecimonas kandeliae]